MIRHSLSIVLMALCPVTNVCSGQAAPVLSIASSTTFTPAALGSFIPVQLSAPASTPHYWLLHTDPGPVVLGSVTVPIGLSPGFITLANGELIPPSGVSDRSVLLPANSPLVGTTFYSVAAIPDPAQPSGLTFSNGVSVWIVDGRPENPMAADAVIVGIRAGPEQGLACLNTTGMTTEVSGPGTNAPLIFGSTLTGNSLLSATRIGGPAAVVSQPVDVEFGAPRNASNFVDSPGRGATVIPGVPDLGASSFPISLLQLATGTGPNATAPFGNYLYVLDGTTSRVSVLDSVSFELLAVLPISGAGGLGIMPDLSLLFVSETQSNRVHVVDSNPSSPTFHQVLSTIPVGNAPTDIAVQPGGEDVLVINAVDETVSVIDVPTFLVRFTFPTGPAPEEVVVTDRMLGQGLTNAYLAFITNGGDSTITVYESDSPWVPANGAQGTVVDTLSGFGPIGGCTWNSRSYITQGEGPGVYVTHGNLVEEVILSQFVLTPWGPISRFFSTNRVFDASGSAPNLSGQSPSDVVLDVSSALPNPAILGGTNSKRALSEIWGAVFGAIHVAYPGAGIIATFSMNGVVIGQTAVPGCSLLHTYYDQ